MAETTKYKGYRIEASPNRLRGDYRWTTEGMIVEEKEDTPAYFPFTGRELWESRELAVDAAIHEAKRIIDKSGSA